MDFDLDPRMAELLRKALAGEEADRLAGEYRELIAVLNDMRKGASRAVKGAQKEERAVVAILNTVPNARSAPDPLEAAKVWIEDMADLEDRMVESRAMVRLALEESRAAAKQAEEDKQEG